MATSKMNARRPRSRRALYEVVNMPPPWKRSLTESGMSRRTTDFDRVVVALFVLVLVAMFIWVVAGIVG